MRDKLGLDPLLGMGLMLATMVGFSALAGSLLAGGGDVAKSSPFAGSGIALDCTDLLTPQNLGPGDFERYDMGDKLRNNQFQTLPFAAYTL